MSRGRVLAAGVGVALVLVIGMLAYAMTRGVGATPSGRRDVGGRQMAPFSLARFDGTPFVLNQPAPGPVFVYFWASWCVPCQAEAPVIQKLWPEYEKRGYTFVGVNIWDAESDARRFIDQQGLTFPVVADANGRVYVDYGVEALPDSYFLEPGLRARIRYQGALTEPTLRELLDELARRGGAS
ncbi:MAG: TlpA disulfide reductase family protein [Dehalococcoidia bacterium]